MKSILPLKDKFKGQDIWVVASGATMDYVNPRFFDNKITIGVNRVYSKFPNLSYYVVKEHDVVAELVAMGYNTVCSEFDRGILDSVKNDFDCYFFKHTDNHLDVFDDVFDREGYLTVSWSTITSAIHLAYYLGGRNILLCGHTCGLLDGKDNFEGYPRYAKRQTNYTEWLRHIEAQSIKLREMLNQRGVNVYSLNPFLNIGLEGHTFSR